MPETRPNDAHEIMIVKLFSGQEIIGTFIPVFKGWNVCDAKMLLPTHDGILPITLTLFGEQPAVIFIPSTQVMFICKPKQEVLDGYMHSQESGMSVAQQPILSASDIVFNK